jgi:predicted acylesterase/phospholipase RssA
LIKHIAFVSSIAQSEAARRAISRVKGKAIDDKSTIGQGWDIQHPMLKDTTLRVYLLTNLNAVTPHLRQNPVDLLVYDERGEEGIEAQEALEIIQKDVKSFADLWGPDFLFPTSRIVAILDGSKDGSKGSNKKRSKHPSQANRALELGRYNVRDVCVAPENTITVLKWLYSLVTSDSGKTLKVGVALSGGGLEGFLYQLGVIYALERAFKGRKIGDAEMFSGVSSGSIGATMIAASISIKEVIKGMHGKSDIIEPFTSSTVFDLASGSIIKRALKETVTWNGLDPVKWAKQTLRAIPTGFFKGDSLRAYIRHCLETTKCDDSFSGLKKELFIGTTDMDSFEHIVCGKPPWDDIPISEAIYASCALPLFFVPSQMKGRWFIDGQITKTCNLELLVQKGCDLVFIIDPVKPLGGLVPGTVDKKGGYYALIQTVKALVYTRFHAVLSHLTERFPKTDFIVFQPDEEVAQMMAGSPMRYKIRTQVIHMAYQQTVRQLRERHRVYAAKLQKYGMNLLSLENLKTIELEDEAFFREIASDVQ